MKHITKIATSGLILLFSLAFYQPALAQEEHGVYIGGYGELHYNNIVYNASGQETAGTLDFHRFVLSFGYRFNDWISFHSELALEHALVAIEEGGAKGGEIGLEKAYINLQFDRSFGLRAGIMLVPVGIVNTEPEPTTFYSVERPGLEEILIPSTWHEAGIGFYGETSSGLSYQAYVMAGLAPNGISGAEAIVEARQNAFKSSTANLAITARLDYRFNPNLTAGISYFYSSLNSKIEEGQAEKIAALDNAKFSLVEAHAIYEKGRFEVSGLLTYSKISDVKAVNNTFNNNAGESQFGGYVTMAFDLLPSFVSDTEQQLYIFGRYGNFDTQYTTAAITDNPYFHRTNYTFGLAYYPIEEVVIKADYQILNLAGEKNIRQLNLGIAYEF